MLGLGNTQVKITVKLLATGIIVGMDHTGICSIGNSISPLCHSSCIDPVVPRSNPTNNGGSPAHGE